MSLDSFRDILAPLFGFRGGSGGRKPDQADMPSLDVDLDNLPNKTWLTPCKPGEARLTVVQITDVCKCETHARFPNVLLELSMAL